MVKTQRCHAGGPHRSHFSERAMTYLLKTLTHSLFQTLLEVMLHNVGPQTFPECSSQRVKAFSRSLSPALAFPSSLSGSRPAAINAGMNTSRLPHIGQSVLDLACRWYRLFAEGVRGGGRGEEGCLCPKVRQLS